LVYDFEMIWADNGASRLIHGLLDIAEQSAQRTYAGDTEWEYVGPPAGDTESELPPSRPVAERPDPYAPDPDALLMLRPLQEARRRYGPDMTLSDAYRSEPESIGTPTITLREALRIYGDGCTLAEAMDRAKVHGWDVDD
jgi:hypothetical protein